MKTLKPINPFTLETAGEYPVHEFAEIRMKVAAARRACQAWRRIEVGQRVEYLRAGLQYFEANRASIAKDITSQMGKPIGQSENELKGFFERAGYMLDAAEGVLAPESLPPKPGFIRRIEHVPLGVVLIIAPWNYPLLTAVNGVAAALLAGNAVLLKHSSLTPAVAEHFARAFGKAGPVEDLLQALVAGHQDIDRVIRECDIDHVVFTGSVEGGHSMQQAVSARGRQFQGARQSEGVYSGTAGNSFIDAGLELGGKDGAYVAEDADLAKAAADLVDGAMYNAGQSCCGIERVYVHRNHFDDFVSRCRTLVAAYALGNPLDHKTTMGPLASAGSAEGMAAQVEEARSKGARILAGGKPILMGKGTFFEPTLLTGVDHTLSVMQEENFGPILPVMAVRDDEEAIRLINDSRYGLTSAIYTSDPGRAEMFAAGADTGTVYMNRCDYLDPALPWTGVRDSGRGSTLSKYGFYGMTRRKAIHFRV